MLVPDELSLDTNHHQLVVISTRAGRYDPVSTKIATNAALDLLSHRELGSYSDPKMIQLIAATITGPLSQENQALVNYANYVGQQVPVIFNPTGVGTYGSVAADVVSKKLGGYAASALGFLTPEDWYFVK